MTAKEKEDRLARPIVHLVNAETMLANLRNRPLSEWGDALTLVQAHITTAEATVASLRNLVPFVSEGSGDHGKTSND